jgi:inner membrane transporter RhtA
LSGAKTRRFPASALAVLAIFCVQFGNAFAGSFFEQVGPMGAAALRLAFGATLLALVVRPRMRGWDTRTGSELWRSGQPWPG